MSITLKHIEELSEAEEKFILASKESRKLWLEIKGNYPKINEETRLLIDEQIKIYNRMSNIFISEEVENAKGRLQQIGASNKLSEIRGVIPLLEEKINSPGFYRYIKDLKNLTGLYETFLEKGHANHLKNEIPPSDYLDFSKYLSQPMQRGTRCKDGIGAILTSYKNAIKDQGKENSTMYKADLEKLEEMLCEIEYRLQFLKKFGVEFFLMSDYYSKGCEAGVVYLEERGERFEYHYTVYLPENEIIKGVVTIQVDELTKINLMEHRDKIINAIPSDTLNKITGYINSTERLVKPINKKEEHEKELVNISKKRILNQMFYAIYTGNNDLFKDGLYKIKQFEDYLVNLNHAYYFKLNTKVTRFLGSYTLFGLAVCYNREKMCEMLIDLGIDVNVKFGIGLRGFFGLYSQLDAALCARPLQAGYIYNCPDILTKTKSEKILGMCGVTPVLEMPCEKEEKGIEKSSPRSPSSIAPNAAFLSEIDGNKKRKRKEEEKEEEKNSALKKKLGKKGE